MYFATIKKITAKDTIYIFQRHDLIYIQQRETGIKRHIVNPRECKPLGVEKGMGVDKQKITERYERALLRARMLIFPELRNIILCTQDLKIYIN